VKAAQQLIAGREACMIIVFSTTLTSTRQAIWPHDRPEVIKTATTTGPCEKRRARQIMISLVCC
ncbi:hypothetical protein, partial [Mesorhizobium sp. M7A.F.Ca.AU.002.06.1.1]